MKQLFYMLLFVLHILACKNDGNIKLPNDVKWVTQSSEYTSLCEQIYSSAGSVLQNQFEGVDRPVIVMDLDETVLNNVQYQVELFEKSETYNPTSWNVWVDKELASTVPGAKSFILDFKQKYKGLIVFISNREASTLEATQNNLDKLNERLQLGKTNFQGWTKSIPFHYYFAKDKEFLNVNSLQELKSLNYY